MPEPGPLEYAVVRVVPHVEREEFINVGIILHCRSRHFLAARIELDAKRLRALAPELDLTLVEEQLDLIRRICAGGAAAGALGALNQTERFRWLVSPRSTSIQVSAVHAGLCSDPEAALEDLFEKLVR